MNDEFSRILSQQIDHYNNDPNADRINRLKGEMSQVSPLSLRYFFPLDFFRFCNLPRLSFLSSHKLWNFSTSKWNLRTNVPFMWCVMKVRVAMIDNIDRVLERGDRLAILVDKTATLQGNTFRFRRQSRNLRNAMWWRNVKLTYVSSIKLLVHKMKTKKKKKVSIQQDRGKFTSTNLGRSKYVWMTQMSQRRPRHRRFYNLQRVCKWTP